MIKIKNLRFALPLLFAALTSCEEMSLAPTVENTFEDEYTWKFANYAQGVLMNAYADIPGQPNHYENNFLDVATDNAVTNSFSSGIYNFAAGAALSPHSNPIGDWNGPYSNFNYIHLFLKNGLGKNVAYDIVDETADAQIRDRLRGEAYFLRAFWGFQLLKEFGGKTNDGQALGYPIVTEVRTAAEVANANTTRNTYEECVQQILTDIDSAVYYLPLQYTGSSSVSGSTGLGRADDQVALALKSRMLLYAASPAFQPDQVTRITAMGQFSVGNATAYTAKWVRAAQAAQQAMNVLTGPVPGLTEAGFSGNTTSPEFIWRKYFNNRDLEADHFPPLNFGNANTTPSQNLVDAFPAKNGYPIDHPLSGYNPGQPYANRDPRLTLNVLHDGQDFLGKPLETFVGGKDTKAVHYQATRTGYYLRKWLVLDNLLDPESPRNAAHYHALIRKTELLLNLAEAANEAFGPTATGTGVTMSALDALKKIRTNAGITNHAYITSVAAQGKDAFRKLIQNERRIELAFENHRYFDMRRWVLPLNETVMGIRITKNADGSRQYQKVEVEKRNLNDIKYYYLPIPYSEQIKSENLVNNLGW